MDEPKIPENPPGPAAPSPSPGKRARKRRSKKGVLGKLPPVPEPVNVAIPGLSPRKAFYGWIVLAVLILVAGISLNWVLTDGQWAPDSEPATTDPDAVLGNTPAQFLTVAPYDLLTAALFTLSIAILALSLVTPSPQGRRVGVFGPLALTSGGLAAVFLALAWIGPHLASLPRIAALASGNGPLIAALVFGLLGLAFWVVGMRRTQIAAKRHEIRALGWIVFAGHWALTGMYYYVVESGDWVNMSFAYAAVFLLGYFAYQEFVSRSLGKDNDSLRFTAAAVVIAAGVWYAFIRVEFLAQILIETVAVHTVWMLETMNQNVVIGTEGQTGFQSAISYPDAVFRRTVIIILACTAIQSMMIFVAAAFAAKDSGLGRTKVFNGLQASSGVKYAAFLIPGIVVFALSYWLVSMAPISMVATLGAAAFISIPIIALLGVWVAAKPLSLMQRRILVIAVTVPVVYVLNLARNTGIIIMWADRWLERTFPNMVQTYASWSANPDVSGAAFGIAHNWVGKGGSLIALVAIAFIVFKIMPEVLRALVGLLDLPRRRGPLEQHWRAIRGHSDKAPAEAPETA